MKLCFRLLLALLLSGGSIAAQRNIFPVASENARAQQFRGRPPFVQDTTAILINFHRRGQASEDLRYNNISHNTDFSTPGIKATNLKDTNGYTSSIDWELKKAADESFGPHNLAPPYAKYVDSLSLTRAIMAPKNDSLVFRVWGLIPFKDYDFWFLSSVSNDLVDYRVLYVNDEPYVLDSLNNNKDWDKIDVTATDSGYVDVIFTVYSPEDNEYATLQALAIFGDQETYSPIVYEEFQPPSSGGSGGGSGGGSVSYAGLYTTPDSLEGHIYPVDSHDVFVYDLAVTNTYAEDGWMNTFRWDNDRVYEIKGSNPAIPFEMDLVYNHLRPARITGIHFKGHFGGSRFAVLGSKNGKDYDTLAVVECGFNQEIAYALDDTVICLKFARFSKGNWPDGLEIFMDTINGDPRRIDDTSNVVLPHPDLATSLSANIFMDDTKLGLSCFEAGCVHREYFNEEWARQVGSGLFPNDKFMWAPFAFVGDGRVHFKDLKDLGQKIYWSQKQIPNMYGRSAFQMNNDLNLKDRGFKVWQHDTLKVSVVYSQANQAMYWDSLYNQYGDSSISLVPDGKYESINKMSWLIPIYEDTNIVSWIQPRFDTIVIQNGKSKYLMYFKGKEQRPLDDFHASATDPGNWTNYARALATLIRIGGNDSSTSDTLMKRLFVDGQALTQGQGIMVGAQGGNEDNKDWMNRASHTTAEEMFAKMMTTYDSVKAVDSTMDVYLSGLVGMEQNYYYYKKICYLEKVFGRRVFDVGAGHTYLSNLGSSSEHNQAGRREAQTPERYNVLDDYLRFQNEWNNMSGSRPFTLDEWGYDDHPNSPHALEPTGNPDWDPELTQAEGLNRFIRATSIPSMFQNKPVFMLRDPGNGGYSFATCGLKEGKYNNVLKTAWYMFHNYTHSTKGYTYESHDWGNKSYLPWYTVNYRRADSTDKMYHMNLYSWTDTAAVYYSLYVPNAVAAYRNDYRRYHPNGIHTELPVVNDTVKLWLSEKSCMVFTNDSLPASIPAPGTLYHTASTDSSVAIKWWNDAKYVGEQMLEYSTDQLSWTAYPISSFARDTIIYGLDPATTYYTRMKNTTSFGLESAYSEVDTIITNHSNLVEDTIYEFDFNDGVYDDNVLIDVYPEAGSPVQSWSIDGITFTFSNIAYTPKVNYYSIAGAVYPEVVMEDSWVITDTCTLTITGLSDNTRYKLSLFQSSQKTENMDSLRTTYFGINAFMLTKMNMDVFVETPSFQPQDGQVKIRFRAGLGNERPGINAMKFTIYSE